MRQMRLCGIAQLELIKMADRAMEMTKCGRELRLVHQSARQMQLVAPCDLRPIHQCASLDNARPAAAPWIVKGSKIRNRQAPVIAACDSLWGGTEHRQHRQGMQDGKVAN